MTSLFLTLIFSIQTYAAEPSAHSESKAKKVYFQNGSRKLGGLLYKPSGVGPFPTLLYNHGSAPGSLNDQAADLIAPKFLEKGWAFFMPYRRGQGLSSAAGPYVSDEISKARESGGVDPGRRGHALGRAAASAGPAAGAVGLRVLNGTALRASP